MTLSVTYLLCMGSTEQEKEMEKQKLLYQQARLHDRGAAEMVLQTISASKGTANTEQLLSLTVLNVITGVTALCLLSNDPSSV